MQMSRINSNLISLTASKSPANRGRSGTGRSREADHTACLGVFLLGQKIRYRCPVGWLQKGGKDGADKYADADLIQRRPATEHTDQYVQNADCGQAVAQHHQKPPVVTVCQYSRRDAQHQRGQKGQQRHQRHAGGASGLVKHINAKAEAGETPADGRDKLPLTRAAEIYEN